MSGVGFSGSHTTSSVSFFFLPALLLPFLPSSVAPLLSPLPSLASLLPSALCCCYPRPRATPLQWHGTAATTRRLLLRLRGTAAADDQLSLASSFHCLPGICSRNRRDLGRQSSPLNLLCRLILPCRFRRSTSARFVRVARRLDRGFVSFRTTPLLPLSPSHFARVAGSNRGLPWPRDQ